MEKHPRWEYASQTDCCSPRLDLDRRCKAPKASRASTPPRCGFPKMTRVRPSPYPLQSPFVVCITQRALCLLVTDAACPPRMPAPKDTVLPTRASTNPVHGSVSAVAAQQHQQLQICLGSSRRLSPPGLAVRLLCPVLQAPAAIQRGSCWAERYRNQAGLSLIAGSSARTASPSPAAFGVS